MFSFLFQGYSVLTVYADDGDYGVPVPNAIEFHIVDGDGRYSNTGPSNVHLTGIFSDVKAK